MDPRDFIMGPNRLCPRCGQEALGTVSVGRLHAQQCRNCLGKVETELPRLHKKVIYIDQFAISNMMKVLNSHAKRHEAAAANPLWLRLFDRLDLLRQLQLIVCPSSDEHDRESSFSPESKALRRIYEHLSAGRSFLSCEQIRLQQVYTAVVAWAAGEMPSWVFEPQAVAREHLHEWMDRLRIDVDLPFPTWMVDGMRDERNVYHNTMSDHFRVVQTVPPHTFTEWVANERAGLARGVVQAFMNWRSRQLEIIDGKRAWTLSDARAPEAVDWMEMALHVCGGDTNITEARTRAFAFFTSSGFADIPFNQITCLINAVVCMRATVGGQTTPPNQGMDADLRIVSTLLPYCDAMFIDNGFRSMLIDIPKSHQLAYQTQVFSTNTADEFLNYLGNIESAAPAEHITRVVDVYGETWLKPRRRLFDQDTTKTPS